MQVAVANMPIMTQNEARRIYLGLGLIERGDKLMAPNTMAEAGTTVAVEGKDQTPQLAKTAEGRRIKSLRTRTVGKPARNGVKSLQDALKKAFGQVFEAQTKVYQSKSLSDLTHGEYMEHRKKQSLTASTLSSAKKSSTTCQMQRGSPIADRFDLKEWISITIDLAIPILTTLAKDEAAAAFSMIGVTSQNILADEATADALEVGIAKMARSYNETTPSPANEQADREAEPRRRREPQGVHRRCGWGLQLPAVLE
jgi:hypothetical protein